VAFFSKIQKLVKDKLRAYSSLGKALGRHARHAEALDVYLKALHMVNEFPKRFIVGLILRELAIVRSFFKKHYDSEIMMLPKNTDETKVSAMEHLYYTSTRCFHCQNAPVMVLLVL
jgi:hypothetical protein